MTDFDPGEYTIAELGPAISDVEDPDELREILEAEKAGEDRAGAKTLIESRIEQFSEDEDGEDEGDERDLAEMSIADVGNAVRDIDEPAELEALLEEEEAGENRDSVIDLIESRIESVTEDEEGEGGPGGAGGEGEGGEGEPEPDLPPAEKHPELDHPTADKQYVSELEDGVYRDMWVYCETQAGELVNVSLEMLGKARDLMDEYNADYDADERVVAVLIGDDVAGHADTCIEYGADLVVTAEDDRLDRFRHKPFTELFCEMARADAEWKTGAADERGGDAEEVVYDEPRYVLFPATNNGRDLSAMVQAELDSGLASDCSGLYIESAEISNPVKTGEPGSSRTFRRVLHMKRPDFSGFEYSTILCLDNPNREFHPQGGSVIPGSFAIPEPDPEREGEVVAFETDLDEDWLRVDVEEFDRLEEGIDLTGHDVIVAVGRGIGKDPTRGIELAVELADAFEDAEVGVSRGLVTGSYNVDAHVEEYLEEVRQIGETGQEVEPDLYIAAGISGAVQHKVGCDEADTIVAVNTDPDARIHDWCDYFVEGDLFEVLPRFIEAAETGDVDVAAATDGGESQ
ncbi:electron transfer flavoprotein subunit alpha/FixB family protein [Haloparvum sp. PAK95]|uniref:electron transfer flavoprotein subunit alpha/FixB family protein n=1 Tax=Haloparvum sp. PAK95 TaxID=3418962 RepID=UPI003D2F0609